MNQREVGFCQWCRAPIPIGPLAVIDEHGPDCPGEFHRPAILTFGPGWISWTIAAGPYARSMLIDPISRDTVKAIHRATREN